MSGGELSTFDQLASASLSTGTGKRSLRVSGIGFALVVLLFAVSANADPEPTDTTLYDRLTVVNQAPGVPEGSMFAGFENNENVQLYNGNLLINHPSSPTFPWNGGMNAGLARVYNSKNAQKESVAFLGAPHGKKEQLLPGETWVSIGWTMHLGRIFRRSVYSSGAGGPEWDNEGRRLIFEDSLGTEHRIVNGKNFESAGPNLRVEFFPGNTHTGCNLEAGTRCPTSCGNTWTENCAHECVCTNTLTDGDYFIVTLEDGTKYKLEQLRVESRLAESKGWIGNYKRAGWYTTRITDVNGNAIKVTYWNTPEFPEAIKEITPDTATPTWKISTTLYSASDSGDSDFAGYGGWNAKFVGMLKEVKSTGFLGLNDSTYKYVYGMEQASDHEHGSFSTPVLREVKLPPVNAVAQGAIKYGYHQGPVGTVKSPGWGPILDEVIYPLGGVSRYEYSNFDCGLTANPFGQPGSQPRKCFGIRSRKIFPDGVNVDGSESGRPRATWLWSRYFGDATPYPVSFDCGEGGGYGPDVRNEFISTGPEGLQAWSQFHGGVCGAVNGLPAERWSGQISNEVVKDITGAPQRKTDFWYEDAGWDWGDGQALKVVETEKTTTFFDDTGACFGVGVSGSPKVIRTKKRQRDNLSQYRLSYTEGDYIKYRRTSYVNYDEDADGTATHNIAPQCRRNNGIRSKYDFAFVEEGASRYEVHFKFRGDSGTGSTCDGRLHDILAHASWGTATITDPDTATPPTAQFNKDYASGGSTARDLHSVLGYDANGNLTGIDYEGGDRDPATGVRKSYHIGYTWQSARAVTMQVADLTYPSRNLGVDVAGNITTNTSPNGLSTGYSFDTLGRLTNIDPPGSTEQATRVIYPSLLETRVIRSAGSETDFSNSQTLDQLFVSEKYDGLGRVSERRKSALTANPGESVLSIQIVRYDQRGREIFTSEWMYETEYTAAPKQTWNDANIDRDADGTADPYSVSDIPLKNGRPWGKITFYGAPLIDGNNDNNPLRATPDPLGRVRRIVLADGSVTDKSYCGPHEQETVQHVRTALSTTSPRGTGDFSDVTTRYYKDGLGRLVAVDTMPLAGQSGNGVGADALYNYDLRGNLSEVNLIRSNGFTSDPFLVWKNGPTPDGQKRTFTYNAVGRLVDSFQPEKGNEKDQLYDVWGNLLAWQDQLGVTRGYYFRNVFDGAGRLIQSQRRAGTLSGETVSGTGDRDLVQDSFNTGMDSWEEGRLVGAQFHAEETLWNQISYADLACITPPQGQTGGGLYLGDGSGDHCDYSSTVSGAQLVRKTIEGAGRDDALSFKYYRATRESNELGIGGKDRLSVWVSLNASDTTGKRILFSQSEAQAVYQLWIKTPAIRPADFFTEAEWPASATRTITLFFVFEQGDIESVTGVGAGVAIDDVYLGRKDSETLAEQAWDETVCSSGAGGDACTTLPIEPQERSKAQLTTVKSYQDGVLLNTKRYVFKGLNGRLSGVRSQMDWTGVARPDTAGDWNDIVYGVSYTDRGLLDVITSPYVVGVTEKRDYDYTYRRDATIGMTDLQRSVDFLKGAGMTYDSAGMPTKLEFANDTTQTILRDPMHRPLSITSTWTGDSVPLFATGTYQFDSAGNIFAIGGQDFVYDVAGRLTKAWMLPQASARSSVALHKLDYAYDWFGNIRSQQMATESGGPTPPIGLNFTLTYDSSSNESSGSYYGKDNTNRIIDSGFAYDANGNSLRFRGQYQQSVGALWTPLNRMRAFIEGDPTAGASFPSENYAYDASGYRLVRIDKSGKPVLSLRDEKGSTLSEFIVDQASRTPRLDKDFVYANGQLLVERTVSPAEPSMKTHSTLKTGSAYNFQLTSQTGFASYAVDISGNSGWRREVGGLHPNSQNVFAIDESNFSAGESNYVRVRIESPQASGYSAPVSLNFDANVNGSSANQIRSFTVSREGTNIILRWALNQSNGKQTRLYFKRADGAATYLLTPQALNSSLSAFTLDSQALASPCGGFWGTQFSVGIETGAGPATDLGSSRPGEQGTQDGCGGTQPPAPSVFHFTNQFHHRDHLGSARVSAPDSGVGASGFDTYPYGTEMATVNPLPAAPYAGYERDKEPGLDRPLLRPISFSIGRFLRPDMFSPKATPIPGAWNSYSYSRNDPMSLLDPGGTFAIPRSWRVAELPLSIKSLGEGLDQLVKLSGRKTSASPSEVIDKAVRQRMETALQHQIAMADHHSMAGALSRVPPGLEFVRGASYGTFQISGQDGSKVLPAGEYWFLKGKDSEGKNKVWVWSYEVDKNGNLIGVLYVNGNYGSGADGKAEKPWPCEVCDVPGATYNSSWASDQQQPTSGTAPSLFLGPDIWGCVMRDSSGRYTFCNY